MDGCYCKSDGAQCSLCTYEGECSSPCDDDNNGDKGEAPTLTRVGPEHVLPHDTEKVTLNVSGGRAPEPSDGNGPYTAGEKRYIYTYSELTGDPSSGAASLSDELNLNRTPDGYADVCVEIEQEWIYASGSATTTTSPKSAAVPVKVQTPTSLHEKGTAQDAIQINGSTLHGLTYTYEVKDQKVNLHKAGGEVFEKTNGHTVRVVSVTGLTQNGQPINLNQNQMPPGWDGPPIAYKQVSLPRLAVLGDQGTFDDFLGTDICKSACSTYETAWLQAGLTVPNGTTVVFLMTCPTHIYQVEDNGKKIGTEITVNNQTVRLTWEKQAAGWVLKSVTK